MAIDADGNHRFLPSSASRREMEALERRLKDAYESDLNHALIFRNISLILVVIFFLISSFQVVGSIAIAFLDSGTQRGYGDIYDLAQLVSITSAAIIVAVSFFVVLFVLRIFRSFESSYRETQDIISDSLLIDRKAEHEAEGIDE